MAVSEAKKAANKRYNQKALINKGLTLNRNTEQDLIEWLQDKSFASYVKELIRQDMKAHEKSPE